MKAFYSTNVLPEPVFICRDFPHEATHFWDGEKWTDDFDEAIPFYPSDNLLESLGFEDPWKYSIFVASSDLYKRRKNDFNT